MDWNRIEENWDQVKYKVRDQWGKFTFDDLWEISGKREHLEKKLQQRYGYGNDYAKKEVDEWYTKAQSWPDKSNEPPRWAGY
ncbi:CsbD family protein [Nitrobacter sp. NHB1]|uniref:CsbD family protein n=1 Tax=Nitrobacter sp. NHB1 TaxID=3119830 RepID=UPI002FFE8C04